MCIVTHFAQLDTFCAPYAIIITVVGRKRLLTWLNIIHGIYFAYPNEIRSLNIYIMYTKFGRRFSKNADFFLRMRLFPRDLHTYCI